MNNLKFLLVLTTLTLFGLVQAANNESYYGSGNNGGYYGGGGFNRGGYGGGGGFNRGGGDRYDRNERKDRW